MRVKTNRYIHDVCRVAERHVHAYFLALTHMKNVD